MILFGYISSFVVAIVLTMFYLGNMAQQVVLHYKDSKHEHYYQGNVTQASHTSYIHFSTQVERVKNVKPAAMLPCSNKLSAFITDRLVVYYIDDWQIPPSAYKKTHFSRPPPVC